MKKPIRILLTAVLLAGAVWLTHSVKMPVWQQLLVFLVPYLLISYDVLGEAWEGIMDREPFDENLLMCIATIGALLIGFLPGVDTQFPEAVFVMLFFQIGELFEHYAEHRSRDAISHLMEIRPDSARLVADGQTTTVTPDKVAVGDVIEVRPGERIPLDGIITTGSSSLNTVALTGESMPRDVTVGDEALSGCVNISGVLHLRVAKVFSESTASKILQMVEEAGERKSRSETFITRFARVYTPIVVILALLVAIIPPFFHASWAAAFPIWLERALTFLVVSCPCALVMSVPLTFFGGIGGASRQGILIKGSSFIDVLNKVRTVVLDKTGTLTEGQFQVEVIHPEDITARSPVSFTAV